MKKLTKNLILMLIALVTAFTFSACSFKADLGNDNDGGGNSFTGNGGGTTTTQTPTGSRYTLEQIDQQVAKVTFNNQANIVIPDADMSITDAVAFVDKSSVAIYMTNGSGSGTIIDVKKEGDLDTDIYVLTCHHVIEETGEINVILPDENCCYDNEDYTFSGEIGNKTYTDKAITLIGGDRTSDIALLKIDLTKPAVSGNILSKDKVYKSKVIENYDVKKGQEVFAIGNPSGTLPGSVATGNVSYLEREAYISDLGNMTLLQMNVTINPGNSGGGLYNLRGELIGVTNAGRTDYEAINYAIPATLSHQEDQIDNGFKNIVKCLLGTYTEDNYGYVPGRTVKFGIVISVTASEPNKVVITSVENNSIAKSAGFLVDDVIKSVTLKKGTADQVIFTINSLESFDKAIKQAEIGESIAITVSRKTYVPGYVSAQEDHELSLPLYQYHFCDTGVYPNA